jgi:NADH-quinone oxidoreductase subunit L
MVRIAPILHYAPDVLTTMAIMGAVTALIAAGAACAQDDIKKVLAYSTISQLGYMFLGIGSGGYAVGLFHMLTHAFFKALLFLGAGSVIHGMHGEQDMKRMGGLRKWMPITFITFLVGWLAISGIPPFAGFWSKDEVLAAAWHKSPTLWAIGFVVAGLTAYYMTRQVALVWFGKPRWQEEAHPAEAAAIPETAHAESVATAGADHGSPAAAGHGGHDEGGDPHESPWTMTLPLIVLGLGGALAGLFDLPYWHLDLLNRWLEPVLPFTIAPDPHVDSSVKVALAAATTVLCLLGMVVAFIPWLRSAEHPALEPALLEHAWYYDAAVSAFVGGPGEAAADFTAYQVDKGVIDGAVNGVAGLTAFAGRNLRKLQSGYVRNYALGIAGGAAAILLYVALRAGS